MPFLIGTKRAVLGRLPIVAALGGLAFDPAKAGPDIVFTNSNKTIMNGSSAGAWATALATVGQSSGKYRYGLKISALPSSGVNYALMMGLANPYAGGEGYSGYYLSQWAKSFGLGGDGTHYLSGFTVANSQYTTLVAVNDAMWFDVDLAGNLWTDTRTSGHSGYDSGGNPGTGANPFLTFTPGGLFFPAATVGGPGLGVATNAISITLLNDAASDPGTLASGFSYWPNS